MAERPVSLIFRVRDFATAALSKIRGETQKVTDAQAKLADRLKKDAVFAAKYKRSVRAVRDELERMGVSQRKAVATTNLLAKAQAGFVSVLKRTAVAFLGVYSLLRLITFTRESVKLYFHQEKAVNSLRTALERAGESGGAALAKLEHHAEDLQVAVNIADEDILRATARVSQLVPSLNVEELEKAQNVLVGLTTITKNIDTAGLLLGKALGGDREVLSRYAISVDQTGDAHERLQQLMNDPKIRTGFEILAGNAKTVEGRVLGAKLAFADLREQLGGIVVDFFSVGDGADSLAVSIRSLTRWLKENRTEITRYGQAIGSTFKLIVGLGKNSFDILGTLLAGLFSLIEEAVLRVRIAMIDLGNWLDQNEERLFGKLPAVGRAILGIRGGPTARPDTKPLRDQLAVVQTQQDELRRMLEAEAGDFARISGDWLTSFFTGTNDAIASGIEEVEDELEDAAKDNADKDKIPSAPGLEEFAPVELLDRVAGFELPWESAHKFRVEINEAMNALRDLTGEGFTFGDLLARNIEKGIPPARELQKVFADLAFDTMMNLGSAVEDTTADVVSGSITMGQAFQRAFTGAVAAAANAMADFYMAQAVAALAAGLGGPAVGGGPQGFAAAAKFGAASLAMRAVAGIAGGLGRGSAGGSAGGALGRGLDQVGAAAGEAQVTIYGSLLDVSDPRVADSLQDAVERMSGRRVSFVFRDAA